MPLILNLGSNGGEWLRSRSSRYTTGKKRRCALNRKIDGLQSRSGLVWK